MLWLGIGATIGANLSYGAGYGLLGALISAWPAVAFIGAVEIVMQLVRRSRGPRAATSVPEVPGDVEQAVRASVRGVGRGGAAFEPAGHGRSSPGRERVSEHRSASSGHIPPRQAIGYMDRAPTIPPASACSRAGAD
jgi:hypothetical protein